MKRKELLKFAIISIVCAVTAVSAPAQEQTAVQQLSILDERLSKLRADVDALQFSQQQLQQDIKQLREQLEEVRRAGPNASANDLAALESRVKALDAARETDKKAIIDQLAKELAKMSGGHSGSSSPSSQSTDATNPGEHVVQKGETLTSIAKSAGVTIADLRKANNLTSDSLKVGQKLVIPQK
jgi:murein DD-endopeptidase MepM/ murein hydrolase activator NlpD